MFSSLCRILEIFNQSDCYQYAFVVCGRKGPSIATRITFGLIKKFIGQGILRKIFLPDETSLKKEHSELPDDKTPHYELSADTCVNEILLNGYSLADIMRAVEMLDIEYRSVYVLYMAGLSVKQVSERLNKPEDETARVIEVARRRLDSALENIK